MEMDSYQWHKNLIVLEEKLEFRWNEMKLELHVEMVRDMIAICDRKKTMINSYTNS